LREVGRAEREFEIALQIAQEIDAAPRMLDALFGLARVDELQNNLARAVERSAFVAAHDSTDHQTRQRAQEFLETFKTQLNASEFENVFTRP